MSRIWRLLRWVPEPLLRLAKRVIPAESRFRLRQRFGARVEDIPDRLVQVADGRRFHIGPDSMYWAIHQGLEYEPEVTAVVRALTREGDVAVDAGANFGWFTTLFAALAGPTGRVLAFEPVPESYARLAEHVALNSGTAPVVLRPVALAEAPGTGQLRLVAGASGAASLTDRPNPSAVVSVPLARLDDELAGLGLPGCDLLKLDVEGAELRVLQGAGATLRGERGPIVLLELNAAACRAAGYDPGALFDLLHAAGYEAFFGIVTGRRLMRVRTRDQFASLAAESDRPAGPGALAGMAVAARWDRIEPRLRAAGLAVRESAFTPSRP